LSSRQHAVAISTSRDNSISTASLYDAAEPTEPLFFTREKYCYEEWMYGCGASSKDYLLNDLECIESAIDQFRPDIIIVMDRIAAVIAARKKKIPCVCIVNSTIYRTASFAVRILQPVNQVLSSEGFEQVFRISDLYDYCAERVVFGAVQIQPMPLDANFRRFGTVSLQTELYDDPKGIYINFSEIARKPAALRKMIIEAFSGAPYPVYACIDTLASEKVQNIHFLASHRDDVLRTASVCIHDGNDFICDACAKDAIPQLIITDHSYGRTSVALAARRYGFGIMADEDELSVAGLYENYRRLVSSSRFHENAALIRDEVISLGDFIDFHRFLTNRFKK
jgi:UDP:flavonoid glycosyltransferase YjiC (YdhE family)